MTFVCMKTPTPLGEMLLASDGDALCGAWFVGQRYFPVFSTGGDWVETREDALLQKAAQELESYFAGNLRVFSVPLAPRGTPFQEKVWAGIAAVPYGRTASYGELAARLRSGPRAVGAATGRNPASLFIPCHRLVGGGGHLTGYAGGLERKKRLLTLEGVRLEDEKVVF
jgi:methylated-DNA-[protein]-cysteine S-methyltransferase